MRIISGILGGRKLAEIGNLKSLRPTTDMAREALFNLLNSANFLQKIGFSLKNSVVLDLCCGTGAVGIEAISRGAKFVSFVDNNPIHLAILEKNIHLLNIDKNFLSEHRKCNFEVIRADALRLKNLCLEYDLVFLDPPYNSNYEEIILSVARNCKFSKNSLFVIEHKNLLNIKNFSHLEILGCRSYGKTNFSFFAVKLI